MHRAALTLALIFGLISVSGCETIKGVGRDITRGAEALDRTF